MRIDLGGTAHFEGVEHAACRGTNVDLFYPGQGDGNTYKDARAVCATCPVRQACLDYALDHAETWGVWGGLTERERKRIRIDRNRGAA